ncbi:Sugar phosphate isomerase/epimerase [Amycolatopsis marina]|uniref:Sugar phosphate isomerase/epimerase n=1 Tax=Amycolatopsis marina TaxID=490629 RepID=A0A1I1CD95_9PSEU|nr:EboA domain-containing protein [Amycolatopsis marina]SFB58710.1 Sugar phosphate isomerase/epimerase [Amycolatopsis marina]
MNGLPLDLGYGTNGFANHRLDDALDVLADLGYTSVALTLDHCHLDPFAADLSAQLRRVGDRLGRLGLRVVVETGARYLLDPYRKHHPTLLSDEPGPRLDFLRRAVLIAGELGAECVSFWSGALPAGLDATTAWQRLLSGVDSVVAEAATRGVRLGLEPEPGHFVAHLADALRLRRELGEPEQLGITLDVGHCVAIEPASAADCIREAAPLLVNVQLDDMMPGVHEHLEFGTGQLDLAGTLAALMEVGYTGVAAVELPRHSHAAPEVARRSIEALRAALPALATAAGTPVATASEVDHPWLVEAEQAVRADPSAVGRLFPAVGRKVGRSALRPELDPDGLVHGTVDDLARARLLAVLGESLSPDRLPGEVTALYRYGDAAERRGVLRALHLLPDTVADAGRALVEDALRTNDLRLVAAALGPFAARCLDAHAWRHGVLKCLFVGVPLAAVSGLAERADGELVRMVADYAAEREAAGRDVPADAVRILQEAGR